MNAGCTPTKTLVASAKTAYVARRAKDFGVKIAGEISVDMRVAKSARTQLWRIRAMALRTGCAT